MYEVIVCVCYVFTITKARKNTNKFVTSYQSIGNRYLYIRKAPFQIFQQKNFQLRCGGRKLRNRAFRSACEIYLHSVLYTQVGFVLIFSLYMASFHCLTMFHTVNPRIQVRQMFGNKKKINFLIEQIEMYGSIQLICNFDLLTRAFIYYLYIKSVYYTRE